MVDAIRKAYHLGPYSCIGCGEPAHPAGVTWPSVGGDMKEQNGNDLFLVNGISSNYIKASTTLPPQENHDCKKRKDITEYALGMAEALQLRDQAAEARKGQRKIAMDTFTRRLWYSPRCISRWPLILGMALAWRRWSLSFLLCGSSRWRHQGVCSRSYFGQGLTPPLRKSLWLSLCHRRRGRRRPGGCRM
jgi:hypothetical protein